MKEQTLPLRLFDLEKEFNFRMSRSSGKGGQHVASQDSRSQLRNKENTKTKFFEKLEKALTIEKPRKKTRIPKALNEKRLKEKKITGEKKALRQKVNHKND